MILFVSCQEALFYSHYEHVDYKGWNNNDTLVFNIPQTEENEKLLLRIYTRITDSYEYNNLSLVTELFEDSVLIAYDTIHINLYDDKGNTLGIGFPYIEVPSEAKTVTLKRNKNYQIRITHAMKLNPIPNISEIGVTFEHFKAKKHQLPFTHQQY